MEANERIYYIDNRIVTGEQIKELDALQEKLQKEGVKETWKIRSEIQTKIEEFRLKNKTPKFYITQEEYASCKTAEEINDLIFEKQIYWAIARIIQNLDEAQRCEKHEKKETVERWKKQYQATIKRMKDEINFLTQMIVEMTGSDYINIYNSCQHDHNGETIEKADWNVSWRRKTNEMTKSMSFTVAYLPEYGTTTKDAEIIADKVAKEIVGACTQSLQEKVEE